MRIEIDFSKPEELGALLSELEAAVATVKSAMVAVKKSGGPTSGSASLATSPTLGFSRISQRRPAAVVVARLNEVFTMREARNAASVAGVTGNQIRNEIVRQVHSGRLVRVHPGSGTTPATFRKVQQDPNEMTGHA